jgi:hypothetical protein
MPENLDVFGRYVLSVLVAFGPIVGVLFYAWKYHWKPIQAQRQRHRDQLQSIQDLIAQAKASKPIPLDTSPPPQKSHLESYEYNETRVDRNTGARYRERVRSQRQI